MSDAGPPRRPSAQSISLCVIARDEAAMLAGCLSSARELVDEMIVVDTGSGDATVDIAREHGAQVEHFAWCDDFSAARNASLSYATGEWVLVLDADERLAPGAATQIRRCLAEGGDFVCGMLRIHDAARADASAPEILSGRARVGEPMFAPRLLRRTNDLAFRGIVHESVRAWLVRHDNRMRDTGADVLHLGVLPDVRTTKNKRARNVALLEKRQRNEPDDFTVHGYLAHEHLGAGDLDRAWQVIEAGWALFEQADRAELRSVLRLTAARVMVQLQRGDAQGAIATADRAETYEGRQPDLSFYRGRAHEALGQARGDEAQLTAACRWYRDSLDQGDRTVAQRYVAGASSWAAQTRLGTVELMRGHARAALMAFDAALSAKADLLPAHLGRVEALAFEGLADEARDALTPILREHAELPDGWLLAALIADVAGDMQRFEAMLREARSRSEDGYQEPHRNVLHGDLFCELLAYRGHPAAGRGAIGSVTAVLADDVTPRPAIGARDRSTVRRFARNLLRRGEATKLEKCLTDDVHAALPWLRSVVVEVVEELGMSVEQA